MSKPISLIQECYDVGQRAFAENDVKELCEKAIQLPADIEWHFIGSLQTNKVGVLLKNVPKLSVLETVVSQKLADETEKHLAQLIASQARQEKLKVFVKVNTSGDETAPGVDPEKTPALVSYILEKCPHLQFSGLMTTGTPSASTQLPDYLVLADCRKEVVRATGLSGVELSMGLIGDFEEAVRYGSTNVLLVSWKKFFRNVEQSLKSEPLSKRTA